MKTTLLSLLILTLSISASAQDADMGTSAKPFSHLDLSVTAGSTGIGVDLSAPLTDWLDVRAGASITPRINIPGDYALQVGETPEKPTYDKNGKLQQTKLEKIQELMYGLTGYEIDNTVRMNRMPSIQNVKFLFDIKPLKNKNWHATVGFYYGSRKVAYAENAITECSSLCGVAMYNNMHRMAVNNIPITVGYDDVYINSTLAKRFKAYGKMGVPMGSFVNDIYDDNGTLLHAKGSTFLLEPDGDNLVKAEAYANRFRPYVGIGYSGAMSKKTDKWHIGLDLGAMYWGKTSLITTRKEQTSQYNDDKERWETTNYFYDIDLTRDVTNLPSSVSRQVDLIKSLHVYPVAELRLTYRIF